MERQFVSGVALAVYYFKMVDEDARPEGITGLTPTILIAQDDGAFAATTNAAVELSDGEYYAALTSAEMTAVNSICILITDPDADPHRNVLYEENTRNKGRAQPDYFFVMVDKTSRPDGKTGLTPTVLISLDGAAFGAATNAAVEKASGFYGVDLTAAEKNADSLAIKCDDGTADTWVEHVTTVVVAETPSFTTSYAASIFDIVDAAMAIVRAPERASTASVLARLMSMVKTVTSITQPSWKISQVITPLTASSEVTADDGSGDIYTCILPHTAAASNEPVSGADYKLYWVKRGTIGGAWAVDTEYTTNREFDIDSDTDDILGAYLLVDEGKYPVDIIGLFDRLDQCDYRSFGSPTQIYFNGHGTTRSVKLDYAPDNDNYTRYKLVWNKLQVMGDIDISTGTIDIPASWVEFYTLQLAYLIAPQFGYPIDERVLLRADVKEARNLVIISDKKTVDRSRRGTKGAY